MRGLVLMGGASVRMGRDKALLNYHGTPQWRYLADLIKPFCTAVFWSCTEQQKNDLALGQHGLVDKIPGHGPASGLLTAFSTKAEGAWLVVACDYPFLDAEALRLLAGARDKRKQATAFRNPEDTLPEPLIAIWERSAQAKLVEHPQSPRAILLQCEVTLVDAPDALQLRNINSRADYLRTLRPG